MNTSAILLMTTVLGNTDGQVNFPWWNVGWSFFNLALILFAIWHFFGKTISALFAKKHDQVVADINTSKEALSQAQQGHDQAQATLDNINDTISDYQKQLDKDLENMRQEQARQTAALEANLASQLANQLQSDRAATTQRLMNNMVEQIVDQAHSNLVAKATPADHAKRIDELIAALDGATGQEIISTVNGSRQ